MDPLLLLARKDERVKSVELRHEQSKYAVFRLLAAETSFPQCLLSLSLPPLYSARRHGVMPL